MNISDELRQMALATCDIIDDKSYSPVRTELLKPIADLIDISESFYTEITRFMSPALNNLLADENTYEKMGIVLARLGFPHIKKGEKYETN